MSEFSKAGKPPVVLTIAGFDPSSGAGVTADLQVFAAHGLFGTAAVTALTVQSTLGVAAVDVLDGAFLRQTLEHLVADLPPAGIKIGMLGSAHVVSEVAAFLKSLSDVAGQRVPVVLDPVLLSSSGKPLLEDSALELLRNELLPHVSWITPNYAELMRLVPSLNDVESALESMGSANPRMHVVATGGDAEGVPTDVWRSLDGETREFLGSRIETDSTHGTGCAFSSALLSSLVLGKDPADAIASAKEYVEGALQHAPGLGHGAGPLNFFWRQRNC